MFEFIVPAISLGAWTLFSSYYLNKAYQQPSKVNPYILESIPSVFPTLGIMCTAIGIAYGLSDFDPNDIQGSLPQLLGGLKSAFYATIAGIAGLIIFQKLLEHVQAHIERSPDRPRQSSDELTALNLINERLDKLERTVREDLHNIANAAAESNQINSTHAIELQRLIFAQTEKTDWHQRANIDYNEKLLGNGALLLESGAKLYELLHTHTSSQQAGVSEIAQKMDNGNKLLTKKFDDFSELLRKNNTEALVEVMRVSTEQFNAQMSELIDRLVKENFKELNSSVKTLNDWQIENKELVERLYTQVKTIVVEVNGATADLKTASHILSEVAKLSRELVNDDSKLFQLIEELDKVMISDQKFTSIIDKVDRSVELLAHASTSYGNSTKDLSNSASLLDRWQRENKDQVEKLTVQVSSIVGKADQITANLDTTTAALTIAAKLNHQLVDDDGKLIQLVKELDKIMISDGKFTNIVDKIDGSVETLSQTTDAFEETTQKLNSWVRNQMNFNEKAEVIVHQLEEFRNLNGSVWEKYRKEMEKSVSIISQTSTTLSDDLESVNEEFYGRLNDTLQSLDGLIQRFMNGQSATRRN